MSAIQALSEGYDYDPHAHDLDAWWEHHKALLSSLEPAQWPMPRNESAQYTEAEVIEMREARASGDATARQLAEQFGCTVSNMMYILRGDYYPGVGGPRIRYGAVVYPTDITS